MPDDEIKSAAMDLYRTDRQCLGTDRLMRGNKKPGVVKMPHRRKNVPVNLPQGVATFEVRSVTDLSDQYIGVQFRIHQSHFIASCILKRR